IRGRNAEGRMQKAESRKPLPDFLWRLVNLAGLLMAAAAVVSPWAIRNYRGFGKPIVTTTHGGYTLFLGNNGEFYDYLWHGDLSIPFRAEAIDSLTIDALSLLEKKGLSEGLKKRLSSTMELVSDETAYGGARVVIAERPGSFVVACVYRIC